MQDTGIGPCLMPHTKVSSKWIKDEGKGRQVASANWAWRWHFWVCYQEDRQPKLQRGRGPTANQSPSAQQENVSEGKGQCKEQLVFPAPVSDDKKVNIKPDKTPARRREGAQSPTSGEQLLVAAAEQERQRLP